MNDETIGRALTRARQDLGRLRAPEGYLRAGWPRFFSYFSRDGCIAAWQTLRSSPQIAADTLRFATRFQGKHFHLWTDEEPGKFPHQVFGPGEALSLWDRMFYGTRHYYAIDVTPLWVILAYRYWKQEGEAAIPVLDGLRTNLVSALSWILSRIKRDGFLVYRKRHPFGFCHQGWRDGFWDRIKVHPPVALVDVQAYVYAALHAGAEFYKRLWGNTRYARYLTEEAEELRVRFDELYWWPEEHTYVFALAGRSMVQVRRVTPDPGMCLFSGIVPEHKVPHIINRLFQSDLWTPYGMRSLSTREPLFRPDSYHNGSIWPFQNWFVWKGLRGLPDYVEETEMIRDAMLAASLELDGMPEAYAVTTDGPQAIARMAVNPIQAWSAGALLDMLTSHGG